MSPYIDISLNLISPPTQLAPSTHRTTAPTVFHSPSSARQSPPDKDHKYVHVWQSGSDCWRTAAVRRPAPGRARGQHGGHSRLGPTHVSTSYTGFDASNSRGL